MAKVLRVIGAGPALIKLREKTSQPLTVPVKGGDAITTVVDEHISLQAESWSEIGETGMFRISIGGGMDVYVAATDIFTIFVASSGVR